MKLSGSLRAGGCRHVVCNCTSELHIYNVLVGFSLYTQYTPNNLRALVGKRKRRKKCRGNRALVVWKLLLTKHEAIILSLPSIFAEFYVYL